MTDLRWPIISFPGDGPEGPVPASRVIGEGRASGNGVVPGVENLGQFDLRESSLGKTVFSLERLPEFLTEPLEGEPTERELVEVVLSLERRVTLGLLDLETSVKCLIIK